ncbi:MAG: hypothetical protein BEN18_08255 [Epulopiscium sp. Nuni2H_MBin001]|nr:MAG: hypothetical protein BEN18_08255 [Epulopiscium sp. Nuni2H_MBin001]
MRMVPVSELRVNSELAIDIVDEEHKVLLTKGHILNQINVDRLQSTNIASVYITDKFCYNNTPTYTSQPTNVLRKVVTIRNAIHNAAQGIEANEAIAKALKAVNEIVSELDRQKYSLRIGYEPKKIALKDFDERTIYIAMMSSLLSLKIGFVKQQTYLVCLGALIKDIAVVSPTFKGQIDEKNKFHPIKGYSYMKEHYNFPEPVLQIILQHHELYDGKGYPYGLKGEEICPGARIIAIIELYYKIKTTHMEEGGSNLEQEFNKWASHLDPKYLDVFLKHANLFEPDMLVQLNNGDIAVVTSSPTNNPFKPRVKILRSETYQEGTILNLGDTRLAVYRVVYYVD